MSSYANFTLLYLTNLLQRMVFIDKFITFINTLRKNIDYAFARAKNQTWKTWKLLGRVPQYVRAILFRLRKTTAFEPSQRDNRIFTPAN